MTALGLASVVDGEVGEELSDQDKGWWRLVPHLLSRLCNPVASGLRGPLSQNPIRRIQIRGIIQIFRLARTAVEPFGFGCNSNGVRSGPGRFGR